MPGAKNGERPYLAVPEATFWGLFFSSFSAYFGPFCGLDPTSPTNKIYFICLCCWIVTDNN